MKLVSFAIPCYNSAAYMRKCIESILPGGDEVEIIVVDDGSQKDDTFEIAKENYDRAFLRIEYISTILQGEIPEGDNIEVIEEESTDFDPVTADE